MNVRVDPEYETQKGFDAAYASSGKLHHFKNKLYISGTSNLQDVWDDVSKIPFYGNTRKSHRYKQAKAFLDEHPEIDTLYGHSLGGSVALQLQKDFPERFGKDKVTTYGAPVLDLFGKSGQQSYRHRNDLVSYLDFGAKNVS